jgi:hypothetical protein
MPIGVGDVGAMMTEPLKIGGDVVHMGGSRACTAGPPGAATRKRRRNPSGLTPEEKRAAEVARRTELHERYRGARDAIQTYLARANPGGKLSDAVDIQLEGESDPQSFFLRQKTCNRSLESLTGKKLRDLAQEVGSGIFDIINHRAAQEGKEGRIQYSRAFNPEDATEFVDRTLLSALADQLVGRIERWREANRVTVTSFNLDRVATPKYAGIAVGTASGGNHAAIEAAGGADGASASSRRAVPRDARSILEMGEGMLEGIMNEDVSDDDDVDYDKGYSHGTHAGGTRGGGGGGGYDEDDDEMDGGDDGDGYL